MELEMIAKLQREVDEWAKAGMRPKLWLRDDDAIDVTHSLNNLRLLVERWNTPLLLAVVPKFATEDLAKFVSGCPLFTPAVHGYSHTSHASPGTKTGEFGDERRLEDITAELKKARKLLRQLFGERLSPIFVPPWNRLGKKAVDAVFDVGFCGISSFGWQNPLADHRWKNAHVDVIYWRDGKKTKSAMKIIEEISDNLTIARANNFHAVGLLTHHLVHDDLLWRALDEVFSQVDDLGIEWIAP